MAGAQQQARDAAVAAVPSVGSVNRQYGQSEGDVSRFTEALARILQAGPSPGAGYTSALTQQQGIDSAAANQLAGLGGPFAAGSAAAVGGLGRSALSSLAAQGAAASAYGAKMPGVAAARGQFGVQSLENARQQALQTRQDNYRSAYLQALQQARSNIFNQRLALSQLGLQKQQLAFNEQNAAAQTAYRYAALRENASQFKAGQAQQFQEFQLKLQASIAGGGAAGTRGMSAAQIRSAEASAFSYVNDPKTGVAEGGMPIGQAIRNLIAQGVPRAIAVAEAQRGYANLTRPQPGQFQSYDKNGNLVGMTAQDRANYQAALRAYAKAYNSFRSYVNLQKWRRIIGANPGPSGGQPGRGTRRGRAAG